MENNGNHDNRAVTETNGIATPGTVAKAADSHVAAKIAETPKRRRPVSDRKREANRRNAKKSTGPKTLRGKANTRLNALKHGLLASAILLFANGEEKPVFEHILRQEWQVWEPEGYREELCVQQIAICRWKQRRALLWELRQQREASRLEWGLRQKTEAGPLNWSLETTSEPYGIGGEPPPEILVGNEMPAPGDLSLLIRYDTNIHRQLQQATAYLKELQRERKDKSVAIEQFYKGRDG
ncbi:MAG TPA: hypothetical protein VFI95_16255 [Terriglobales bacterium]|nr:hypothetical protein [Terriglobales bacterium]